MLSGGAAPGCSQYSLPGWIVLLVVILALRREAQRSPNPIATQQIGHYVTPSIHFSVRFSLLLLSCVVGQTPSALLPNVGFAPSAPPTFSAI